MGPKSGWTWAPCASGAMVNHFQANFKIQNVQFSFPVVNLVRSRSPRPSLDPKQGFGALNRVWRKSTVSTVILGKNFIK